MPQTGPTVVNIPDNISHGNATSLQYNCLKNYKQRNDYIAPRAKLSYNTCTCTFDNFIEKACYCIFSIKHEVVYFKFGPLGQVYTVYMKAAFLKSG